LRHGCYHRCRRRNDGVRAWLGIRGWALLTPRRMRAATVCAITAGLVASSVRFTVTARRTGRRAETATASATARSTTGTNSGGARRTSAGARGARWAASLWRTEARRPDLAAYYGDRVGALTLDEELNARGKVRLDQASSDSGIAVGFFNARRQGRDQGQGVPREFLASAPTPRAASGSSSRPSTAPQAAAREGRVARGSSPKDACGTGPPLPPRPEPGRRGPHHRDPRLRVEDGQGRSRGPTARRHLRPLRAAERADRGAQPDHLVR
jgi:hypothetical protein